MTTLGSGTSCSFTWDFYRFLSIGSLDLPMLLLAIDGLELTIATFELPNGGWTTATGWTPPTTLALVGWIFEGYCCTIGLCLFLQHIQINQIKIRYIIFKEVCLLILYLYLITNNIHYIYNYNHIYQTIIRQSPTQKHKIYS